MSIDDLLQKIKPFYALILVIVVGSIFFAIGRLSSLEEHHTPIRIEYSNSTSSATVISAPVTDVKTATADSQQGDSSVIGSKSGKKYYFPWCGTVKRIKPENQVHFASITDAKKAGFIAGGNCKGLK